MYKPVQLPSSCYIVTSEHIPYIMYLMFQALRQRVMT